MGELKETAEINDEWIYLYCGHIKGMLPLLTSNAFQTESTISDSDIENNQCVTANGSYIKFNGDATCTVTVTNTSPTISYSTPYLRVNSASNTSLTTKIATSDWQLQSDGRYKAVLYLRNAKLTKIYQPDKVIDEYYDCSYNENYDCSYNEDYDCRYNEDYDCSYNEDYDCSYNEDYGCSYNEDYDCSYDNTYTVLRAKGAYAVTYSYIKNDGTREVKTATFSATDDQGGDYKYYIKLPGVKITKVNSADTETQEKDDRATGKFAARKYSVTEAVYDMIDFSENTTGNKNGYLSSSFGYSYSCGFYYVGSSSVNRTLTTSRKGRLELKVAPSFYADSGYIKMNYGNNTSAQTITAPTTLSMKYSDLSSGTMQFTLYNCVILYAKLCDAEATISSPNTYNSQNLRWNTSSPSVPNISLSGSYSNWNSDEGWHQLTNSNFLI